MDFQTLTEDQFSALAEDTFATLLESGGTSGGTCLYDATAIAAIKSAVDGLTTAVANLQADITAIKARMPQTGTVSTLTADDVWVYPVSDESVPATDVMTIMIQRTGGILANKNALSTIDTVVDAIKAKTDKLPAEPAAKSDVQITVNADGIDVPTAAENASAVWSAATRTLTSTTGGGATAQEVWQYTNRTLTSTIPTVSDIQSGLAKTSDLSSLAKTSDLSDLAKPGDAMTLTTAYDAAKTAAQPSDVQLTTTTETVNVTTQTVDISGLATAANLSALQTTANAIKTQTDKIPSTSVTPSDITALRTHGDSNWSTATGFATPADISTPDLSQVNAALTFITALLGNWTVSGNILTTYDDSGAVLKTYALTRDSNNNIISIS
ncbi:MAG: hypothetical protein Q4D62_12390 [Planctomycetia bacterium]|nr:hypothetical protein [Planctomycetia bacterium]